MSVSPVRSLSNCVLLGVLALCEVGCTVRDGSTTLIPRVTVSGRVIETQSSLGLGGVSIQTFPPGGYATTNSDGQYVLAGNLEVGVRYRLEASKPGYATAFVEGVGATEETELTIADVSLTRLGATLSVPKKSIRFGSTGEGAAFVIENTGNPNVVLSWSISSTADWLDVDPKVGDITGDASVVTLNANRLLLAENWGEYATTLTIISSAGSETVDVTLAHRSPQEGVLLAESTTLTFGAVDVARTARFENFGQTSVDWEILTLPPYVSAAVRTGTVAPGNFVLVELMLDRAGLLPGAYSGEVRISSSSESTPQTVLSLLFEVPINHQPRLTETYLDFGTAVDARALSVSNEGNTALSYEVILPEPWQSAGIGCAGRQRITATPTTGTLTPGGFANIIVQVDRVAIVPGDYTRQLTLRLSGSGGYSEARTVGVRYVVTPHARLYASVDVTVLDRLEPAATLSTHVQTDLTQVGADPCDAATNVPIVWGIDIAQPWLVAERDGALFELATVPGGVIDVEVGLVQTTRLTVDWSAVPQAQGTFSNEVTLSWCAPEVGLPYSCDAEPETVVFTLRVDVPGPQVEFVTYAEGPTGSAITNSVGALNPFDDLMLFGQYQPSFGQKYWGAFDVTPGKELDYLLRYGEVPSKYSSEDRFVQWSRDMVYDWANDYYLYVQTFDDQSTGEFETYTWALIDATWVRLAAWGQGIQVGVRPSITYDTTRNRVVMYGGAPDEVSQHDALYVHNGDGTWTQLASPLIGGSMDVNYVDMLYDANQDRYIIHGGKPLLTFSGNAVLPQERTWAVDPDSFAVTPLTLDAGYVTDGWSRKLVHNVEQNITYAWAGCRQSGTGGQEYCGIRELRVLLNEGNHPDPIPPFADTQVVGGFGDRPPQEAWPVYDPNFDRILFVASWGGQDPETGANIAGAQFWHLIYERSVASPATITVSQAALNLGGASTATLQISNPTGELGTYSLRPQSDWLSANPPAGYIAAGTSVTITVSADTAALTSGTHLSSFAVQGPHKQLLTVTVEASKP